MKKITILFAVLISSAALFGQKTVSMERIPAENTGIKEITKTTMATPSKADAYLMPGTFNTCADSQTAFYPGVLDGQGGDAGYATGTNLFGDQAYAQRYTGTYTVKGVGALLAVSSDGDPSTLYAKMFAVSNNTIGAELASVSFSTSSVVNGYMDFTFATPQTATNFAVSISVPTLQTGNEQIMAISATGEDCYSGNMSYTLLADNSWATFVSTFDGNYDVDIYIFPIVDAASGISDLELQSLTFVYPVPAKNEVHVASSIEIEKVELYSLMGQKIYTDNVGGNAKSINVSDFATGQYIAKIYTEAGVATKKVVVQ